MSLISRKDPIEYKQPQEFYCSNFECLNEVADQTWPDILDDYGKKYSKMFCLECITESKIR